MVNQQQITKIIELQLKTPAAQEKYLDLITNRIEENRKIMGGIFVIMLLCVFAFPLIVETKINEIVVGPFKLKDNSFAISIIPSIFALCYYKYALVWIDLVEQKNTYKALTSKFFSLKEDSYLNERLVPFSFADKVLFYHLNKSKKFACALGLFWIPIVLAFIFFPFIFEYYTSKTLFFKYGLKTVFDWLFFLTPIVSGFFTVLIYFQAIQSLKESAQLEDNQTVG